MTAMIRDTCSVCEVHTESVYRIEGMDCHEEVAILERRLRHLPGLEALSADVLHQRLQVTYDAARLSAADLVDAVAATGMRAWLEHEQPKEQPSDVQAHRVRLVVVSGLACGAGLLMHFAGLPDLAVLPAYGVSIVAGGALTARRALIAARSVSLDINVLMLVAVTGAVIIGEWSEGAAVIFLFALAQWLETRSMDRARHAIRALMELAPAEALVRRNGSDQRIRVDDLRLGDVMVVRPGEKIPLDGAVLTGETDVNQAPITGESFPVEKRAGDEVFAGTINGQGAVEVRVTRLRRDTTMARIIGLVESAQAQRAPAQAFVERFARVYTPAVLIVAAAVAVLPPLVAGQPVTPWLYRALVLLVISCPCALVISTPVSIVSALAAAARNGVLIKGGVHLERTAAIRAVAFDKTGTLTRGRPEVVEVLPVSGVGAAEVLRLAAGLETRSEHPLARAILRRAQQDGVTPPAVDGFQALAGLGAQARVGGESVLIGNHRLFEQRGLCSPAIDRSLEVLGRQGRTAVLVARRDQTVGIIAMADQARVSGRGAIQALRESGIGRIVLLTGDNAGTAQAVAEELGVDEFLAELLPADKVEAVAALRARYGLVAMVGDGVNDAPALAAADVGIAMGAACSDAALETADVALMADDLLRVPYLLRLGRDTVGNVKANIVFAIGLKAVFLALAVAGVATLWMAVVADMGASLIVIANGLRLLRHN
ncbi:MAG TPA: heavy metal translocating P-type ATPase [Vicinamibacterales bacterium]|jgi:Cd2+/Zn2+-exporting ATPase